LDTSTGTSAEIDIVEAGAIIVGAGIAGLATALAMAPLPVLVIARSALSRDVASGGAASIWAQGGIAAALGADDSAELHAADTLAVGGGTNDPEIVRLVTASAAEAIGWLQVLGVTFDRTISSDIALGREAGHSRRRIVHAGGDRIGAELIRFLSNAVRQRPNIDIRDDVAAEEILVSEGGVHGLLARTQGKRLLLRSRKIVLATGGIGGVFDRTTNPTSACGDGLAMAARAGALISDPEFVQFHPTALDIGLDPMPLATEALRGEGALLIDDLGIRFMPDVHPDAELAPRDIVARAVFAHRSRGRTVFLDCRQAIGARFAERFPTVYASCRARGLDPATDPIPVAPAAHYHMGGIAVDSHGRSSITGLWACGEVASTGLHGANRLASNSLLEALVFAPRVAADVRECGLSAGPSPRFPLPTTLPEAASADPDLISRLRTLSGASLGVVRNEEGLRHVLAFLAEIERRAATLSSSTRNRLTIARLIGAAALQRRESRGSHFRSDYPLPSAAWKRRSFLTLSDAERIAAEAIG
jgi:L-aspartate oxidase